MSLADLSSKLYTIKSRKNLPISSAFVAMIREDLAMRYSVYNIVKSMTGSEIIAQVAESKYGIKTPIQKEEEAREKKKLTQEKRYKQFTVDSLIKLNNKINTLSSITERNTILIENLYNDLGSFRFQKKFTKRDMNTNVVKLPLRSRTVKFQIDEIKQELDALSKLTLGKTGTSKVKRAAKSAAVGAAAAAGGGLTEPTKPTKPTDQETPVKEDSGGVFDTLLNIYGSYKLTKLAQTGYRFARKKFFPTAASGTATPVTNMTSAVKAPTPALTAAAAEPAKVKPMRRVRPIGRERPPLPQTRVNASRVSPSEKFKLAPWIRRLPIPLGNALFNAGKILGTGPQTIGLVMGGAGYMASGKAGEETLQQMQEIAKKFGIKFSRSSDGTPLYEINGEKYTSETLPPEYQTILNAYIGDTRSFSAMEAKKTIAAAPALYNSLVVEGPPIANEMDVSGIIAAAKAAQISVPEPQMMEAGLPDISAPQPIKKPRDRVAAAAAPTPVSTTVAAATPSTPAAPAPLVVNPATTTNPGLPIDFLAFSKRISELESGGKYNIVNSLGYLGKYQFGAMALQDMGLVKKGTSLRGLDDPNNWTIPGGKQAFLNDPKLQEESFAKLTKQNYNTLKRLKVISVESPPDEVAGFLAVSHLLGPGGARDLIKGKVGEDAYGTKSTKYYAAGSQTQKLYLAQLRAPGTRPVVTVTQGVGVAAPPMVASATTASPAQTSQTESAEIASRAALVANKMTQDKLIQVADKVSVLDALVNTDREFPSVRNRGATV